MAKALITWENGLRAISFDAIPREQHDVSATATEHPVQGNTSTPLSTITDHIVTAPRAITLDAIVSDIPIGDTFAEGQEITDIDVFPEYSVKSHTLAQRTYEWTGTRQEAPSGRRRRVMESLDMLVSTGTIVNIVTSIRSYEGFVITSASIVAENASMMQVTVNALEIRVTHSVTRDIDEVRTPKRKRDKPGKNKGQKATREPYVPESEKGKSFLLGLLGG